MKGSFRLGTIAGIGVFVHWTFSILIAYIIFSSYRQGADLYQTLWLLLFVLSIFVTVFLHELGHATAARRYHIKTRDITLLPIGGVARLDRMPEKPLEELVVALAGPAVNVIIAVVCAFMVRLPETPEEIQAQLSGAIHAGNFMLNFILVNLWLSVFNLLPAFPMDGGRVLRAILSMRMSRVQATRIAVRTGQLLAIGFVFAGFYINPFLIFIGLFVLLGAQAELESVKAGYFMKGYQVGQITMKHYESLEVRQNIGEAVSKILNGQCKTFLINDNGTPVGTLNREGIIKALAERGHQVLIADVMNPDLLSFDSSTPVEEAYRKMTEHHADMALVSQHGNILGVIDTENILEFIMIQSALEQRSTS
jgi:Zn-dependent protease/predicted transcriptional regulator